MLKLILLMQFQWMATQAPSPALESRVQVQWTGSQILQNLMVRSRLSKITGVQGDRDLTYFLGKLNKFQLKVVVGNKPFFKTITPSSKELFMGFFNEFKNRASVRWDDFAFDANSADLYRPDEIQLQIKSQSGAIQPMQLSYEMLPSMGGGKERWHLFGACIYKNHPVYFILEQDRKLDRMKAMELIENLFWLREKE